MNKSSAKKIICLSSVGAGSTKKLADWKMKTMIWLAGLTASFEAKAEQELMLYQSTIDFTLVMAGTLTDKEVQQPIAYTMQHAPCVGAMPA